MSRLIMAFCVLHFPKALTIMIALCLYIGSIVSKIRRHYVKGQMIIFYNNLHSFQYFNKMLCAERVTKDMKQIKYDCNLKACSF